MTNTALGLPTDEELEALLADAGDHISSTVQAGTSDFSLTAKSRGCYTINCRCVALSGVLGRRALPR